jgi:tetratricopeptide (TPR) repeat protein
MLLEYFATRDDELSVEAIPNAKPSMISKVIRHIFSGAALFLLILLFLFLVSIGSKLLPGQPGVYFVNGNAWYDKGEYDKAIADYGEAIRLDPKFAMAYNNRGLAWSAKQAYDQAIADYDKAIDLDPKLADAYNNRAWLWATCPDEKYRDGKKALESATRACELTDWKEASHLDTLAAAYAECGDFAHAIEYQEKAQGLYKDEKDRKKGRDRLALYREKKPYRDVPEAK